ncbi:hypothetical protein [Lentzea sp. HUAS12]|uniref:hypothetical protein n=1 Tax=Lentzea sp. HUAS12 TaxID=2951806 RepID=UPI00209F06B5|nr:hypothetical protein [Lentzea sp. HUAS12]USX49256.1 hypothetical protein ND450_27895 [Lentzea sp. HUAS12]
MLSHVEITARVELTEAAHFWWANRIEYSHDCFVCRRTGRTVTVHHGAAHGVCQSAQRPLEWQAGPDEAGDGAVAGGDPAVPPGSHPAPIRITGFDAVGSRDDNTLRCRLSFWWSPFADVERPQARGGELGTGPWVRLFYRVGCHACRDAGEDQWFNGEQSLQTNAVWPVARPCRKCGTDLVTMTEPPEIRLVG